MQLKNKLFLIFLFFGVFLIFNSKVFASSDDFILNFSSLSTAYNYSDFNYKNFVLNRVSSLTEEDLKLFKYVVCNYAYTPQQSDIRVILSKSPIFKDSSGFSSNDSFMYFEILLSPEGNLNRTISFSYYDNGNVYNNFISSISAANNIVYTDSTLSTAFYTPTNNDFFPLPPIVEETPTLAEVMAQGHQQAKEITQESLETELAELIPVGVVIMASLVLVYLIAYFKFWRA